MRTSGCLTCLGGRPARRHSTAGRCPWRQCRHSDYSSWSGTNLRSTSVYNQSTRAVQHAATRITTLNLFSLNNQAEINLCALKKKFHFLNNQLRQPIKTFVFDQKNSRFLNKQLRKNYNFLDSQLHVNVRSPDAYFLSESGYRFVSAWDSEREAGVVDSPLALRRHLGGDQRHRVLYRVVERIEERRQSLQTRLDVVAVGMTVVRVPQQLLQIDRRQRFSRVDRISRYSSTNMKANLRPKIVMYPLGPLSCYLRKAAHNRYSVHPKQTSRD